MSGKVFITGVAGFLGAHLAEAFLKLGYDVLGIDNLLSGCRENVPDEVDFKVADCNDRENYLDMMNGVDLVYHCAAAAYEGLSVFSPHFINYHICNATVAVLSAAAAKRVKRFIFCSSMARYGNNTSPFVETMPVRPVDPYGISKCSAELMAQNICQIHNVEYNIAVPHNIIGPRQKYDDPYRNVASIMINRMLRGQQPIIYGDGSQMRCFSFISDVIYCLVKLGNDEHIVNDIFNIGPDEDFISILQLAREIASLLNFDLHPIFVPKRPMEVQMANCCADKARKYLGYHTTYSLRDGLKEMIQWIEKKGPKDFQYNLPLEIISEQTPSTWTSKLI
jgi:UDP-glucose 4-epimerase